MTIYCPNCGKELEVVRDVPKFWAQILRCPDTKEGFLFVDGEGWIFHLIPLDIGVLEKVEASSSAHLEMALDRIKRIDYKTISSLGFEHTLLDCYDPKRMYRVVYPDGSET